MWLIIISTTCWFINQIWYGFFIIVWFGACATEVDCHCSVVPTVILPKHHHILELNSNSNFSCHEHIFFELLFDFSFLWLQVTTVDRYQGQQNDYVLISLVRTKAVGHLRDVRRLVVAMSRARLGLYIFARVELFQNCYELSPAFNQVSESLFAIWHSFILYSKVFHRYVKTVLLFIFLYFSYARGHKSYFSLLGRISLPADQWVFLSTIWSWRNWLTISNGWKVFAQMVTWPLKNGKAFFYKGVLWQNYTILT